MNPVYNKLPLDLTGTDPANHVGSEEHLLVQYVGLPYAIITLNHGGFYTQGLRVYDADYNLLMADEDYVVTYYHKQFSERNGLRVCSAIVFLNQTLSGIVYVSAQMVGGDLAFSFTAIDDYVAFYGTRPAGYVPVRLDYLGEEPMWAPGELDERRWGLDMFQPYNIELENIKLSITTGSPAAEEDFRQEVRDLFDAYVAEYDTTLADHIANKLNPHVDVKADIGLQDMFNQGVASEAVVRAGVSNDWYLTPKRGYYGIDEFAAKPLNAHVALNPANAHQTTPVQVNSYTIAKSDELIAAKYLKTEQVANALALNHNGGWYNYSQFVSAARNNLDTSHFSVGYVNPARLGLGTPDYNALLRGNGQWVQWQSLVTQYADVAPTRIERISGLWDNADQAMAFFWTIPAYQNINTYPVGSLMFFVINQNTLWGNGNGSFWMRHFVQRAILRTASGWVYLG
jgi:hypothetical protein